MNGTPCPKIINLGLDCLPREADAILGAPRMSQNTYVESFLEMLAIERGVPVFEGWLDQVGKFADLPRRGPAAR